MSEPQNKFNEPAVEAKRSKGGFLMQMLRGEFLQQQYFLNNIPFFFYLALLCTVYIANSYFAVNKIREITRLETDLREYQSRYITLKADITEKCKSSRLAAILEPTGIAESVEPPKIIVMKGSKPQHIY
jgi:hypothetical protein